MATHGDIGLSQPVASTITARLDAITLDANSTTVMREVMVIGSPETTNALTAVLAAAPKSTDWGMAVRVISGPSTATDFAVRALTPSTYADAGIVRAQNSTATDFLARVNQGVGNSSLADAWKVGPASTAFASSAGFHFTSSGAMQIAGNNSSAADRYLSVRLTDGAAFVGPAADYTAGSTMNFSTITGPGTLIRSGAAVGGTTDTWQIQWGTSNGAAYVTPVAQDGAAMYSSVVPGSTASAIVVRQALPSTLGNYGQSSAFQSSTELNIVSTGSYKVFVYAYSITSTLTAPVSVSFYDGATLKWPVALSSGFGGANLAVTPPAHLFAGTLGSSLSARIDVAALGGSSGVRLAVSYFTGA